MADYTYETQGVCPSAISFSVDEGKIYNVVFHGGCPGNTKAVAKLLEGYDAKKAVELLKGNPCGARGTSCADQLAIAVENVLSNAKVG